MNIEKEREDFENWFRTTEMYNMLIEYIATHQPILKTVFIKSGKFYRNTMVNTAWVSWQASKQHEAKKLEGCVVVPLEPTQKMLDAFPEVEYEDTYCGTCSIWVDDLTLTKGYKAMVEAARGGK